VGGELSASRQPPSPGQLDRDQGLELVLPDRPTPAAGAVRSELVAPAAELAERFAD